MSQYYDRETEDVIGVPPSWILKWGITLFFFFIVVILFVAYIIKYPDIINAKVILVSKNNAVTIEARSSGKIELFVNNNELVKAGQILGYVKNSTNYQDYLELKAVLARFDKTKDVKLILSYRTQKLGRINTPIGNLNSSIKNYLLYNDDKNFNERKNKLEQQLSDLILLDSESQNELNIGKQQMVLAQSQFKRDSTLFSHKAGTIQEVEQSKLNWLIQKNRFQSVVTNNINNDIRILQLRQEIQALADERIKQLSYSLNTVNNSLSGLLNEVHVWEEDYLLVSPISGTVSLFDVRSNNEFVILNQELFKIVPKVNGSVTAVGALPINGSAKVGIGQNVNIKLDNYPYLEYGMLKGKVTNISSSPKQGFYRCDISLTNGLNSNFGKKISFKQGIQGNADIITNQSRILSKIFRSFLSLIN